MGEGDFSLPFFLTVSENHFLSSLKWVAAAFPCVLLFTRSLGPIAVMSLPSLFWRLMALLLVPDSGGVCLFPPPRTVPPHKGAPLLGASGEQFLFLSLFQPPRSDPLSCPLCIFPAGGALPGPTFFFFFFEGSLHRRPGFFTFQVPTPAAFKPRSPLPSRRATLTRPDGRTPLFLSSFFFGLSL